MSKELVQPLIGCSLRFEQGKHIHDNARAVLYPDVLELSAAGFHHILRLNTICSICAEQYKIFVQTSDNTIILSMIGHQYEDFTRRLIRTYNEIIFSESLMQEKIHFQTTGQFVLQDNKNVHSVFRICETGLVILPDTHDLIRIPFSMISNTQSTPYRFEIINRFGRAFILQKMGMDTDAFLQAYETQNAALLQQTKQRLATIAPVSDSLASLLLDGMVVCISDIRNVSADYADALDDYLLLSTISNEYAYLKAKSESLAIGVKRGLMGELTGESIILLAPIFESNIMFMESLSDTALATYVFRITNDAKAGHEAWKAFLLGFNYSMLSVNFRREPIYLSEEALRSEKHVAYNNALKRIPELSVLRKLFVDRVIHKGFDSWKKGIDSFIKQ